ncbi:MAG: hypothetical protein HOP19_00450 [Acidobacteria bacterium]|nr:hypothetical protein [Acidobacteriota bacterium]
MQNAHFLARLITAALVGLSCATLAFAQGDLPKVQRLAASDNNAANASDQQPASVLVYNYYNSDAVDSGRTDTLFNLTNTNPRAAAFVHVFFVGDDCLIADSFICMTANQTASFTASDVDPGVKGYMIAVATDGEIGCPINFNYLIGSEAVKWADGRTASFAAEGFKALYNGRLPGCNERSSIAELEFDGKRYSAAPRKLAVDKLGSLADGNSALLIVNSLNGNVITGAGMNIGGIEGLLFDDAENGSAFRRDDLKCQLSDKLTDAFPATAPLFSAKVPAGRTGWLNLMARDDRGITGAVVNFNPNAATTRGQFNSSHNLHHLSYTSAKLTIPVFPPTC